MSDFDDPQALLAAAPYQVPTLEIVRPWQKPLTFTMRDIDVDPEFLDLIMFGESPGPHITLGEG